MSSTPIDVAAEDSLDELEAMFRAVIADRIVTPEEEQLVLAKFSTHRSVWSELTATISLVRTALHAGIRSAWMARRIEQHDRDICALTK